MAEIVSRFESIVEGLHIDHTGEIGQNVSQDVDKARDSQSDDDHKTIVRSVVNNNVSINSSRYKDERTTNGNESSNDDGDSDADADRETKSVASEGMTIVSLHFSCLITKLCVLSAINSFFFSSFTVLIKVEMDEDEAKNANTSEEATKDDDDNNDDEAQSPQTN